MTNTTGKTPTLPPLKTFDGADYDFKYISFGAGVQSTALLAMSGLNLQGCPRADVAVFADTQCEPQWVYDNVQFMEKWSTIPIIRVTVGNLGKDLLACLRKKRKRASSIPAWTTNAEGKAAPLWRQCTQDYKIKPIIRKVRELLGYQPRQRVKHRVACLLGISAEEFHRMRFSRVRWITNAYPLVDLTIRRSDCVRILEAAGVPVPLRSACVFCPYHSNDYWHELKTRYPAEWKKAVKFDRAIRDMSVTGIQSQVFLHRQRVPLDQVLDDQPPRRCEGICRQWGSRFAMHLRSIATRGLTPEHQRNWHDRIQRIGGRSVSSSVSVHANQATVTRQRVSKYPHAQWSS